VLIAACIVFDLTMNPHSVFKSIFRHREPVYQWVQSEDRTFDFLPGESKAWGPFDPRDGKIRYVINSHLPVDTGLMDQAQWGEDTGAWSAMKKSSACYESRIRSSAKTCPVASGKPQLIFVRDVRAKQIPLDGLSTQVASKKALQEQNSVTITVFAWKCVENCK
jgi:hypothetical protein